MSRNNRQRKSKRNYKKYKNRQSSKRNNYTKFHKYPFKIDRIYAMGGVADSLYVKLCSGFRYELTTGTFKADETFKLNSIADPAGTISAVKPDYHDQYNALYRKYCVNGVLLDITLMNEGADPVEVCFFPTMDGTAMTNLDTIEKARSMANSKWFYVNVPGSNEVKHFKKYYSISQIAGNYLNDDAFYGASLTGDPTRIAYMVMSTINALRDDTDIDLIMSVKMVQYVRLFEKQIIHNA